MKLLGRQSINNKENATFELVKNAHDGDASHCIVYYEDIEKDNPRIRIVDDGIGMTNDDSQEKFMEIGTPSRTRQART